MTLYSPRAIAQVDALRKHYAKKKWPESSRSLDRALDEGERWVASRPDDGIPAPRPYPDLATQGRLWMKAGRYWIGYTTRKPPVIVAVYYDQADIPGRL